MITLSEAARTHFADHGPAEGSAWIIQVHWDRGDVEKSLGLDGTVSWDRVTEPRWRVDVFGDTLDSVASRPELTQPVPGIFVGPWFSPGSSCSGGEIDVKDGELVFRPAAA